MPRKFKHDHEPAGLPYIYALKDPNHGRFCYVGHSRDPELRFRQHVSAGVSHYNPDIARWLHELARHSQSPDLVVLEQCESYAVADASERRWIQQLREQEHPLLNRTDGGADAVRVSRVGSASKKEWIDLGYVFKEAIGAARCARVRLDTMLPANAKEAKQLDKAIAALDVARTALEGRVCNQFPEWQDALTVFFGPESAGGMEDFAP